MDEEWIEDYESLPEADSHRPIKVD